MTDTYAKLEQLRALTVRIKENEEKLEDQRKKAADLVLELLRADVPPMEVDDASPFSAAKQRILARAAGIPPAKKGGRKP